MQALAMTPLLSIPSMRPFAFLAVLGASALSGPSLEAQRPASPPAAPPERIALKAAHLVDPRGEGRRLDDAVVLIEGDKVVQAESRLAVPNGYRVVDLGGATLLPGLIDVHTHLT